MSRRRPTIASLRGLPLFLLLALATAGVAAGLALIQSDGRPAPSVAPAAEVGSTASASPDSAAPDSAPAANAAAGDVVAGETALDQAAASDGAPEETAPDLPGQATADSGAAGTDDDAAQSEAPGEEQSEGADEPPPAPPAEPQLALSPASVRQGEATLVRLSGTDVASAFLTVDEFTTPMVEEQGDWIGFAVVRPLSALGPRPIVVDVFDEAGVYQTTYIVELEVVDADVPIEEITLLPGDADLLAPELVAIDNAVRFIEHVGVNGPRRWSGAWRLPLEGVPTGIFGALRSFNGAPPGDWHHGYDIAAAAGSAIGAPAAALVVFAGELSVHGLGVILDHGAGVFSGYWHMSAIDAVVGQTLRAGQLLGRVGETGLVVGPHLHWEVIIAGRDVDPVQWLDPALHD